MASDGRTTHDSCAALICASLRKFRWVPVGTNAPLVKRSSHAPGCDADAWASDARVGRTSMPSVPRTVSAARKLGRYGCFTAETRGMNIVGTWCGVLGGSDA